MNLKSIIYSPLLLATKLCEPFEVYRLIACFVDLQQ